MRINGKFKALLFKIITTGYWFYFYLYPFVVVILLTMAIWKLQVPFWTTILLFIAGYFSWGFIEYFTHRYLFHYMPVFRTGHEEHHARPRSLLSTPIWISLTAYLLITWGIATIIGYGISACLLAGFVSGYYAYMSFHHIVHHWHIRPNTFFYRYKKFHDIHHYKKDVNFGVSWHIWDKVFRTYHKPLHS